MGLLIDADDVIYPIEIKKNATPSTQASKAFAVAAYLGKTVGPGAVLCLAQRDAPLSAAVTAIPVGYL